jgi:HlyD family secretion protein
MMVQRKYKSIALIAILTITAGLAGCAAQAGAQATAPQTAAIQRGTLTAMVNAAGAVSAKAQVALAFQTSGQVKELDVQPGDQVKAGQVLARLDATNLDLSVAQAQLSLDTAKTKLAQTQAGPADADVTSAQTSLANATAAYQAALNKNSLTSAQITVARAQLDKAAAALQRAQDAYDWAAHDWLHPNLADSPQQKQLDNAQTAYDLALASYNQTAAGINDTAVKSAAAQVAQAQYQLDNLLQNPTPQALAIAQAQVKQAEIGLQQAQSQRAKADLVAPFDGIVADVSVQAAVLVDLSQIQVATTLAEVDMPKVQAGQEVQVTLDAIQGVTFSGKVDEVDLVGVATQGVVNYPATVVITDSNDAVRPGMNASVGIVIDRRENVLLVPNRAVRTQGRQRVVTVLYQDQLIEAPVTLGLTGDTQSEVVSGLQEGDLVVLNAAATTTTGGGRGGLFGVFR